MKKILSIIISLALMLSMISLMNGFSNNSSQSSSSKTAITESDVSSESTDTEDTSVISTTTSKKPSDTNTSSKKDNSTKPTQSTSSTKKPNNTNTSSKNNNSTKPSQSTSSTKKEPDMDPIKARYSADEPNGYSIWRSDGKNFCLDYKGYRTFTFDDDEDNETNVYNNSVITSIDSNSKTFYRLRRASDGKILFTTESMSGASVIIPEYYGDEMLKDGYVLVCSKTESYNGVSYKLGFIDSNGKWAVSLSADNPILKTIGNEASADYFEKQLYYCREGVLAFELDSGVCYLYNIKTNSVAKIQSSENLRDSNISSIIKCGLTFKDGLAVEMYSLYASFGASRCCKIYSNGKTETFALNFNENCDSTFGSKYYDKETDSVITMGYTYYVDGFSLFDSNGKIVKKIDNVDVKYCTGFKSDGTAQLVFENKEGSKYYTVINAKGNFLFEPIKMSVTEIWDTNRYSVECVETHSVRQGEYAVVDNTGKILFQTSEWVYDFNYQNGVVHYKIGSTSGGSRYVEVQK